jgi:hypothetical protein
MFPVPPPQLSDSGIGSETPDKSEDNQLTDVESQLAGGSGAQKGGLGLRDRKLPANSYGSWMAAVSTSDEYLETTYLLPARFRAGTQKQSLQAASIRHIRACLKCVVTKNKVGLTSAMTIKLTSAV